MNRSIERINTLIERNKDLEIVPLAADFSKPAEIQELIQKIKTRGIIPTAIVHLPAAKISYIRFKNLTWEFLEQEMQIQLRSLLEVLRSFMPAMSKSKRGKVILVLSSYTYGIPPKFLTHYITVKYALLGLMKSVAAEYSDKNVTVNAISPSLIETAFLSQVPEEIVQMSAENSPLKRNATVDDIAPVINFLLSKDSDYMTGINLQVTGGTSF